MKIDIDEVRTFIFEQSAETKIYIGADSERVKAHGKWMIDYMLVVVVHINGKNGCRVFGEVQREGDIAWDQKGRPRMRLMNEVYKVSELYLRLADVLEDRNVEIHLDINRNDMYGSSCVVQEAIGYVKATCNLTPMVKPMAFASSYAADRLKEIT